MDRLPNRRFTNGLSSGLSVLALFAVTYSFGGVVDPVIAASDPPGAKTSQVSYKEVSVPTDTLTVKRSSNDSGPSEMKKMAGASGKVDASKGAADRLPDTRKSESQDFHATAYCLKGRTASGHYTRRGVIAADPRVLPIGTVVQIEAGRYTGTYTVLDTGGRIKGNKIDVYVPTYDEARRFGRQRIQIKVLGRARKSDPAQKRSVSAAL
jgi:3D (Asp-Asp-Asp) domain-containing protein